MKHFILPLQQRTQVLSWLLMLLMMGWLMGCRKGILAEGQAPETKISFDEINLSGENRLNSSVRLSWYGSDVDGYIEGYEISLDNVNWTFTSATDSLFTFDIPPGQDSVDIDFYVRAIDNDGLTDPSPAYLQVPLINSPPTASFINERGPADTAFIAATFFWTAGDPDGNNTVKEVQIKINQGPWISINQSQNLITFLADTSVQNGPAAAQIYYGTSTAASSQSINGLMVNDTNRVYIRSIDIAQAVSKIDTSAPFFFRPKSAGVETLWLSGHTEGITAQYQTFLKGAGLQYDLYDLGAQQGARLPKYFDPTVQLIFGQYRKAFLNLSQTSYTNSVTGQSNTLLGFLAPVIQRFTDQGGKYFLTTVFDKTADLSEIREVYPISALSLSTKPASQARIPSDSALVALSGGYPNLQPVNVEFGVVPIVKSSDAQNFYRAELQKFRGWNGPSDIIGVTRRPNNQLTQVFFALELHRYNQDPLKVQQLIGDIFNNEF